MRYSTAEVVKRTGLSYRQVDYLCRTGVLDPAVPASGSGTRREFSDSDLALALVVASLRAEGYTLSAVRRFLAEPVAA